MNIDFLTIFLSGLTSSSLLGVVIFLARNLLIVRLKSAVNHEYDEKIEKIKADLRLKESEIQLLQSGVLSGVVNRQRVLYERRVIAAEELWDNVLALAPAKITSTYVSVVKYDELLKLEKSDPKVQEMFTMLDANSDRSYFQIQSALKVRPFLSELAWALFSAYSTILSIAIIRMEAIKLGIDKDFTDNESVLKIVKIALPHQMDYINKYGVSGLHYLLEELELSILRELRRVLDGKDSDDESIKRASALNLIIKKTTERD